MACPQFFSSKGESGEGRRRSVGKEMQGNDTKMQLRKEIGVKTRKVGGGRLELRDVARRLDFELDQKQKVKFH